MDGRSDSCDSLRNLSGQPGPDVVLRGDSVAEFTRRRTAIIIAAVAIAANYSGLLAAGNATAATTRNVATAHVGTSSQFLDAPGSIPGRTAPRAPAHLSASSTTHGGLTNVAVLSSKSAWAVGSTSAGKTLIKHWNGTAWAQVPSPTPTGGGDLQGVAAVSASCAWAVGYTGTATPEPLILVWNGTAWSRVPSPSIAGGGYLEAVTAISNTLDECR